MPEGQVNRKPLEEDDWKAVYGKPSVRFDEGELEIEPCGYYASSLLYWQREK